MSKGNKLVVTGKYLSEKGLSGENVKVELNLTDEDILEIIDKRFCSAVECAYDIKDNMPSNCETCGIWEGKKELMKLLSNNESKEQQEEEKKEKATPDDIEKHIKSNKPDYNSMVIIAGLFKVIYGRIPKIGMSGQQAEFADILFNKIKGKPKEESKPNTNELLKPTNLVDEESKEEKCEHIFQKKCNPTNGIFWECSKCKHIELSEPKQPPKPEVTEVIKKLKEIIVSINDKEWQEFRDMSAGQILEIIESEIKALEEQEER